MDYAPKAGKLADDALFGFCFRAPHAGTREYSTTAASHLQALCGAPAGRVVDGSSVELVKPVGPAGTGRVAKPS